MRKFLKLGVLSLAVVLTVVSCKNNNEEFINEAENNKAKETLFSNLKKQQGSDFRAFGVKGDIDGAYTFKLTHVTMDGTLENGIPPAYSNEVLDDVKMHIVDNGGNKLSINIDAFKVGKMPGKLKIDLPNLNYSDVYSENNTPHIDILSGQNVTDALSLTLLDFGLIYADVDILPGSYIKQIDKTTGKYEISLKIHSDKDVKLFGFTIKHIKAYVYLLAPEQVPA